VLPYPVLICTTMTKLVLRSQRLIPIASLLLSEPQEGILLRLAASPRFFNPMDTSQIVLYTLTKSQVVPLLTRLIVAVLLILVMATIPLHHTVMAKKGRGLTMRGSSDSSSTSNSGSSSTSNSGSSDSSSTSNSGSSDSSSTSNSGSGNNDPSGVNVIIGTRSYTKGTNHDDTIIGCPVLSGISGLCDFGDTIRGLGGNDIIQGSLGPDNLYGDDGADTLSGQAGDDKLYGGPGDDVLQGGFDGDLLVGGPGNDELYGGDNDDILIGGPGADYFDCGNGADIVLDFNPEQGDTHADNCEVVLTHNTHDIDFITQHGIDKSNAQALGIGSFKDKTSITDLGEKIK
jgi:RTX calcium-binding nonapeptide repeat (4 copies)